MTNYRKLYAEEIRTLERQGCEADDWARLSVADGFAAEHVKDVRFAGDVRLGTFDKCIETAGGLRRHSGIRHATLADATVGDNCLIENIGTHILCCDIGEECFISNVGCIATTRGATFGQGVAVSVKNEAGQGNVVLFDTLSSQMAALMVRASHHGEAWPRLKGMADDYAASRRPERSTIGRRSTVAGVGELLNVCLGEGCKVEGAARLRDVTVVTHPEAATIVGSGATAENSIVQAGGELTDAARAYGCLVGEACHVGRGFTAEASLFFANSYMDNGESCAALCGPFSVSHHKSTLLIGGEYSFYNAGSATNFSNHAYKMGPIHHGTLMRGSKTASGSHILWPATIGAFSVCLGKIESHPDTSALPFSYVIGTPGATLLVPARNLATVGTCRDTRKWPTRDTRPQERRLSLINYDWLSPYTMQRVAEGKQLLQRLIDEGGERDTYIYNGCTIKRKWALEAVRLYDLALRLYAGQAAAGHCADGCPGDDTGRWTDLGGMLCPEQEADRLISQISDGTLKRLDDISAALKGLHERYQQLAWRWAYHNALPLLTPKTGHTGGEPLTEEQLAAISDGGRQARLEWEQLVKADALKEFSMGDVDEQTLNEFIEKL